MKTKAIFATIIFLVVSMFVGAVSAQDEPSNQRGQGGIQPERALFGELMRVATETTGLTPQEIGQQIQDGAALGEIITANGGDVDTVIETVLASASTRLQEAVDAGNITQALADQLLATANQWLLDWMNGDAPFPRPNRPDNRRENPVERAVFGELARVVTETTGLTMQEIAEQIRDGATLGEVITANGGDVDTVIETVLASASTRLQEAVDAGNMTAEQMTEIMETAEQHLGDWMTGEAQFPRADRPDNRRGEQVGRALFGELARTVTETTSLTMQEIAEQIRDGATLGEVIIANGGDVDTVIDAVLASASTRLQEQVAAGNMTAEQMAEIMETAEQHLSDWMNGDARFPNRGSRGNRGNNVQGNNG